MNLMKNVLKHFHHTMIQALCQFVEAISMHILPSTVVFSNLQHDCANCRKSPRFSQKPQTYGRYLWSSIDKQVLALFKIYTTGHQQDNIYNQAEKIAGKVIGGSIVVCSGGDDIL